MCWTWQNETKINTSKWVLGIIGKTKVETKEILFHNDYNRITVADKLKIVTISNGKQMS